MTHIQAFVSRDGQNICVPPRFLCWNRNPHVMVSGGELFGGVIRSWGRALMIGRSTLMKETLESPLSPLCIVWGHSKKSTLCNLKEILTRTPPCRHPDLRLRGLWETNFCCLWATQSMALCYSSSNWLKHITTWFPVWQASSSTSCFYHIMFLQVVAQY